MLAIRSSVRRFSATPVTNKLFNFSQLSSQDGRQDKIKDFIDTYVRQGDVVYSNFVNDIIHHWAVEQPTREALWTHDANSNESQKLTFSDVYKQSCRLANVLTGKEFNLQPGKTVLAILPNTSPERIFLQLACLQSGLVFCPYDPKDLTNVGIHQRIQKLAADCIITNDENFEMAREYTQTPLRPLKKGLIRKCSTSEQLPVGWVHLMTNTNETETEYNKVTYTQSNVPAIRFLSNQNHVIEYSHEYFNHHLLLTALWMNMNQSSRLIWLRNQNDIISIAPWLFGSTIFNKETENLTSMLHILENYPIDTFCASLIDYQMLENQQQQQKNKTPLKQLLSSKSIDPITKSQWRSLTNLEIRDDYADFVNKSSSKPTEELQKKTDYKYVSGTIPFKTFFNHPKRTPLNVQ